MIATVMQPAYLPWLGFFDRVLKSDLLIVLDDVAMDRNSRTKFANRNRIRTAAGNAWLTVPIMNGGRDRPLNLIEIDNTRHWQRRHWRSIESNYRRAACFREHAEALEPFFQHRWTRLLELNCALTRVLFSLLGIQTPVRLSSAMDHEGAGGDLLLSLCRAFGATTYISGPFGRDYLDRNAFATAGIQLVFHDYPHPCYTQVFDGFEPCMSVIDLLFNHGAKSSTILRSDQRSLKTA